MVSRTPHPIEGIWLPFKAELAGDHAPDMALAKMRLVLGADTYAIYFGNEIADEGRYTLGMANEFSAIILAGVRGTNADRTIPSIYQLSGDRLRICYGIDGHAPTNFGSTSGTPHYLVSYRRIA